jgi:hypothetical protein
MAHSSNGLHPNRAGFALGGLLGFFHLVWATLVALGWAQALLDAIYELHMIKPILIVDGYSPEYAVGLVLVTSVLGYIFGYLFAVIWNAVKKA